MDVKRYVPILRWLPEYGRRDLQGDVSAGLTVGVMLIPQGMAYAYLAGLPPVYGLYASVIPLLVYPIFGTSRHLAGGIVAIDMLIVAAALSTMAPLRSARYVELAILLALMVGALQIAMGAIRLGFIVNLLSRPVITGFASAGALIIAFSQLESLLGLPLPRSQYIFVLISAAAESIHLVHLPSLAVSAVAILFLLLFRRLSPLAPAPLLVVAGGVVVVWIFGLDAYGIEIVGAIPTGLPFPTAPAIEMGTLRALLPTAITLALVQFMAVISLGKIFAARHRYSVDPNQELVAMGAANLAGSFFHSTSVSGSFSRTAINAQAGARTPLANAVAALLIALTLLFLTPVFYFLPIPVLGALIFVAAMGLFGVRDMRYLLRTKPVDGGLSVFTFATTLLVGIQEGILLGIAASVIAVMYRISRPNVAVLGHLPGTRSFRDVRRNPDAQQIEGILMLRIDASFSFANAEFLKDLILEKYLSDDAELKVILIDSSSVNDLDTTASSVLLSVAETLRARGIELYFSGVKSPVRRVMERSGLVSLLGDDHFFLSPHRAVKYVLSGLGRTRSYLEHVPVETVSGEYHERRGPAERATSETESKAAASGGGDDAVSSGNESDAAASGEDAHPVSSGETPDSAAAGGATPDSSRTSRRG